MVMLSLNRRIIKPQVTSKSRLGHYKLIKETIGIKFVGIPLMLRCSEDAKMFRKIGVGDCKC